MADAGTRTARNAEEQIPVITYLVRRILLMFPTLIGITLMVFMVMAASPGGISAQNLVEGQNLEPQAKKALEDYYNRLYGLDQPAPMQYLRWLNNISPAGFTFDAEHRLTGFSFSKGSDLGTSFKFGRPVLDLVAERVPITLLLNLLSLPLIYAAAIGIGVRAARERGGTFDVTSGGITLALWSVPTMLAGILLIGFLASEQYWHWFPTAGLSRREALDMPFLPHWHHPRAALALLGGMLGGGLLLAAAGRWLPRRARVVAMGALGAGLGFAMANALPGGGGAVVHALLILVLGSALGAFAGTGGSAVRTSGFALLGILLGAWVSRIWGGDEWTSGFLADRLWHLVLPVVCLSYGGFAFLSKLVRTSMLENLLSDFARTARAKGVPEHDVLWRHVFRNGLLPLITVSAGILPALLGGSVIVETIFSIDGMGKLAVEAVKGRDRELVLSLTLISGFLTLIGYLIADLCYAVADRE